MHGTRNILTFFINCGTKKYEEILARLYLSAFHLRWRQVDDLFLINSSIINTVGLRVNLK